VPVQATYSRRTSRGYQGSYAQYCQYVAKLAVGLGFVLPDSRVAFQNNPSPLGAFAVGVGRWQVISVLRASNRLWRSIQPLQSARAHTDE